MQTFLLDTNALARFILRDIEDQAKKTAHLFEKAKKKKYELFTFDKKLSKVK